MRELITNRHSPKKCLRRCFRKKKNDSRQEGLKSKTEGWDRKGTESKLGKLKEQWPGQVVKAVSLL